MSIALIFAALIALSAAAWVLAARQSEGGAMAPGITALSRGAGGMTMDMAGSAIAAPLFIGMWVTMMVAMMFPSVAPIVVMHWRISSGRRQSPAASPAFVGGYLLVWTAVGVGAYWAYRGIMSVAPSLSTRTAAALAGAVFIGAGAYQLSRFKSICLRHCRGPLDFLLRWRPGVAGAVRMGSVHGAYCVGCCWGLMVLLFVVGLMNLVWMGVVAAVIFVEKVAPFGQGMARTVGFALVALGAAMALFPPLLGWGLVGG